MRVGVGTGIQKDKYVNPTAAAAPPVMDITGFTYNSGLGTFSTATESASPRAFGWSNSGTYLFVLTGTSNKIFRYTCSTPYDPSTASVDSGQELSLTNGSNNGMWVPDSGEFILVSYGGANDFIRHHNLSTAHDLTTGDATGATGSLSIGTEEPNVTGMSVQLSGSTYHIMVVGQGGDEVNHWTSSVANITNPSAWTHQGAALTLEATPGDIYLASDGKGIIYCGKTGNSVYQHNMSSAFDISTLSSSADVTISVSSQGATPEDVWYDETNDRFWVIGADDTFYGYD